MGSEGSPIWKKAKEEYTDKETSKTGGQAIMSISANYAWDTLQGG
jgi:hypothetical protein